ncbi:MAG: hypothetical protein KUG77_07065 [Nannocystaceae bacterium]|nr:hypothetical protein [Nannocystaceae bacterium]
MSESTAGPLHRGFRELLVRMDALAQYRLHRRGTRSYRVVVGLVLLYQILITYGQRRAIYGPGGVYPYDLFESAFGHAHFSLLALTPSVSGFEVIYHGCLLVIVLWTLGVRTSLTTPLTWLAVHTLHQRCFGLWDGGDNITSLLLIYAVFMDLSPRRSGAEGQHPWAPYRNVLHNFALLACVAQVCLVYSVAGLAKIPGEYWQNGTAFYYVLNSAEFGMTQWAKVIWDYPLLLAVLTWSPVLMQLAFPWIYIFGGPISRRVVVLVAMSFHVGIFALMGLESFAVLMIAAELLLLSDDDYRWFSEVARELVGLPGRAYVGLRARLWHRG